MHSRQAAPQLDDGALHWLQECPNAPLEVMVSA